MGISTPTIIMTISWDIAHQQCVAGLSQNARYIYMPISMRRLMRNHGVLGYPILRQAQMMAENRFQSSMGRCTSIYLWKEVGVNVPGLGESITLK